MLAAKMNMPELKKVLQISLRVSVGKKYLKFNYFLPIELSL
jgi:hypothetical protein